MDPRRPIWIHWTHFDQVRNLFILGAEKHNQQDYYISTQGRKYIYFHKDMGFWMLGRNLNDDHAEAFADFDSETCVSDVKYWNYYDWSANNGEGQWVMAVSDAQCHDGRPTFAPATTTPEPDFEGCKTTLLSKILTAPEAEFDCDEKIRPGETCQPTCPTGTMLVCEEQEATCGQNMKWVTSSEKPYMCKCKEPVCDVSKFAKGSGYTWDCDYIDINSGKVPAGATCKPSCNDPSMSAVMKFGLREFKCAQQGHRAMWIHEKSGVPSKVFRWPAWKKSKVGCSKCNDPKIALMPARSNLANGAVDCSDAKKRDSTCTLMCPEGKIRVCQGHNEMNCIQKKPLQLFLSWDRQLKCRCDWYNPQTDDKKPTFNCSLGRGCKKSDRGYRVRSFTVEFGLKAELFRILFRLSKSVINSS